jgi:hypothetical protein
MAMRPDGSRVITARGSAGLNASDGRSASGGRGQGQDENRLRRRNGLYWPSGIHASECCNRMERRRKRAMHGMALAAGRRIAFTGLDGRNQKQKQG